MVTEREGRVDPKVLDFGIAKVTSPEDDKHAEVLTTPVRAKPRSVQRIRRAPDVSDSLASGHALTPSDAIFGSAEYMSPEQSSNTAAVGRATDIYSLGVVAYETLTGRRPFTAASAKEYYWHHLNTKVPPLGDGFSSGLDRVLQRALAKNPEARHGSALELASELRAELRASTPELVRSAAQLWQDQRRAPGLLLGADVLADVERWKRSSPAGVLGVLERSLIAESQRKARRIRRVRRSLGALAVVSVFGAFQVRAEILTRMADRIVTESEFEQGRSALIHGEPEAQSHLSEAYRRDPSPITAFMYARSLQPRLAEQARFTSTFGRMWSAAFSPDGRQIITTDDRNAQVWDAQTYQLLFSLPHGSEVDHAVYGTNGTRLVTAAQDAVRIWDATSGALVRELTQKRNDRKLSGYYIVALSLDGRLVAAIDVTGSVALVWDAATGAQLAELLNDASGFPGLAFSADGHWLATSGGDDVRVFDTGTWTQVRSIPRVRRLAFDPTGPRLLTGSVNGDVSIWEIPSGARTRHLREIGETVDALAFSPDGQLVVAASRDGAEQIWHARSGELQRQFNPRHSKMLAVEFDRTSKLVLAAGADGTVVVADAALGMPVAVLEGPQNVVRAAHFDSSSRRVVGASWDGTARVWDATAPYRRWNSPVMSDDCGVAMNHEPDRRVIAVGCRDHATRVWDTAYDQLLAELPSVSRVDGDFTSAFPAVSAAGDRAAIARGNAVEVYELPGGRLLQTIAHRAPVNAVAFATTGRDLVSGAVDGSLLVARDNGAVLALPISTGGIDAAALLPDGRVIASDAQRRLRVYDTGGGVLADLELPGRVMSLRIDGTRLVTVPIYPGSAAPPVLLDLERYRVIAQLAGHVGEVFSARWVAGGQIITAGGDGTARLWDGSTGQLRKTYRGGSRFLADATLAPDGLVMAGGADGLLRFWDPTSERLLWTLQAHTSYLVGIHVEGSDIVTRGFAGEISRWTLPRPEQVFEACEAPERCAIVPK